MLKLLISSLLLAGLVGCGTIRPDLRDINVGEDPVASTNAYKSFKSISDPAGPPVVVAVYSFKDQSGQRKPSNTLSLFSTAVTQGAEA